MRRILLLIVSVTAALVAAVAVFVVSTLPARALRPFPVGERSTVAWGAYHVHSNRSDGSGSVEEIAAAAARAGLSFVIFTDHGDATRPPDPPRYLGGVLCIDAVEINSESGHVVALNLQQASAYPLAGESRDVIEDIHRLGGWAVIAHPDSARGFGWRGQTTTADGIEWLNVDSEWRGRAASSLAASALRSLVRTPESIASLFQPPRRSLARWDEMQRRRPVFSIAAADAHARLGGEQGSTWIGSLKYPSYESLFRTIVQAVPLGEPLTRDAAADAREILLALGSGQSYSIVRAFADVLPAVEFGAETSVGKVTLGRRLPPGLAASFRASSPALPSARLVLLRDGNIVQTTTGVLEFTANDPGAYRLEAYIPGHSVPWVVTNPVHLGRDAAPNSSVDSEAPLKPSTEPVITTFTIEADPSSRGTLRSDAGSTTLDYQLGSGTPAGQFTAMVAPSSATPVDRIEFTAQSDRPMRFSLQVRVPGGRDGQRWRRSVYADPTPQRHSVPLSELEPVDRRSSLRPVVAKIQSVLLVVDTVNARPGQAGSLTITDLQLIPGGAGGGGG